jgi:Acyl-coenzyme A:6-aminopenicillanic acid acyl-transferase
MAVTSHAEVVAGGPDDFMVVRHLLMRGSNRDIGRALGEAARQSGAPLPRVTDATRHRARRRWFERNWPQHCARMEGIAAAYGRKLDDDEFDFSCLHPELLPDADAVHCSAMWVPRKAGGADGHARVSRNLDFSTGTVTELVGGSRQPGEEAAGSRPYLIETYPDDGPASFVVAFGDFTGCVEGLNEHGLTVALLADDETMSDTTVTLQTLTPQVGLDELHVLRYLLDTCSTAEAAREALYEAKQYYEYAVVHFLVADRDHAFVWERNMAGAEFAVDADADGLCVTNHPLHCRARPSDIPDDIDGNSAANSSYARARSLYSSVDRAPLSTRVMWDALEAVRADGGIESLDAIQPPVRTLWHSHYDIDEREVTLEFYLGDNADGSPRRSSRRCFRLEHA